MFHQKEKELDVDPKDDGITHINIYSRGKTELGRILSNWDDHPIKTPLGTFYGIEPLLFFLETHDPIFWFLSGYKAKEFYTLHYNTTKSKFKDDFHKKARMFNQDIPVKFKGMERHYSTAQKNVIIVNALWEKYYTHPTLKYLLQDNNLPLKHYYWYGEEGKEKKIVVPKDYRGIIDTWKTINEFAKRHRVYEKETQTINKPTTKLRSKWSRKV